MGETDDEGIPVPLPHEIVGPDERAPDRSANRRGRLRHSRPPRRAGARGPGPRALPDARWHRHGHDGSDPVQGAHRLPGEALRRAGLLGVERGALNREHGPGHRGRGGGAGLPAQLDDLYRQGA